MAASPYIRSASPDIAAHLLVTCESYTATILVVATVSIEDQHNGRAQCARCEDSCMAAVEEEEKHGTTTANR